MKFKIRNPTTGCQKKLEIDDDYKLQAFLDKMISQKVTQRVAISEPEQLEVDTNEQEAMLSLCQLQGEEIRVEPAQSDERNQESGGSASGSVKPIEYWDQTSGWIRSGQNKLSNMPEAREINGDEDLQRRFNGKELAYKLYLKLCKKVIILDKGFDANLLSHVLISFLIKTHGWQEFGIHHSEESFWELVREFFANMIWNESGVTWVRGQVIHYDQATLNRLFRTEAVNEQLRFEDLYRIKPVDGDREMIERIERSFCRYKPIYSKGIAFGTQQVKHELLPSVDFFFAKIKPLLHTHTVSGHTLYVLSELWRGKTMNIGALVEKTLFSRKDGRGVLCYPNLIRRLCEQAGVDLTVFDENDKIRLGGPLPLPKMPTGSTQFRYVLLERNQEIDEAQSVAPPPGPRPRKRRRRAKQSQLCGEPDQEGINQENEPVGEQQELGEGSRRSVREQSVFSRSDFVSLSHTIAKDVTQSIASEFNAQMSRTVSDFQKTVLDMQRTQQEDREREREFQREEREFLRQEREREAKKAEQQRKQDMEFQVQQRAMELKHQAEMDERRQERAMQFQLSLMTSVLQAAVPNINLTPIQAAFRGKTGVSSSQDPLIPNPSTAGISPEN